MAELVDLVWLNKASIPNFSALGSGCISTFPGGGGGGGVGVGVVINRYKAKSQFKLD